MPLTPVQKAAALLRKLDPAAAGELLKAAPAEAVPQIAAELVYLNTAGAASRDPDRDAPVEEFLGLLHNRRAGGDLENFVRRMLSEAVGEQRCDQLFTEAQQLVEDRDPFLPIRSAEVESLAQALAGEHPQVAALVLSELPPEKSARLIPLLEESVRLEAVRRMTAGESVCRDARRRIAAMIRERLSRIVAAGGAASPAAPSDKLRGVALLLRKLKTELRDALVQGIVENDPETGSALQNLMVTWEDVPLVSDRDLQEVLREVETRELALALAEAAPAISHKIRDNISERAKAMIDEETSLMKAPKADEIEAAREAVLKSLRERNADGNLTFEEG